MKIDSSKKNLLHIISNWFEHLENTKDICEKRDIIYRLLPHFDRAVIYELVDSKSVNSLKNELVSIKKNFIFYKDEEYREELMEKSIELIGDIKKNFKYD